MIWWLHLAVFILFHNSQSILASNHIFDITGSDRNTEVPVWIYDQITIIAESTNVDEWSFNGTVIAVFDPTSPGFYNNSNALLPDALAEEIGASSHLILSNITRIYTGVYEASAVANIYSLNMTVYGNKS